jgi:peptide/nickel transport system substrate-binding protein
MTAVVRLLHRTYRARRGSGWDMINIGMLVRAGLATVMLCAGGARAESVLKVSPGSDLTALDPMGPAATVSYMHGLVVYDMLFAQDENLTVRPQMVGQETISPDKLNYTLTLRPGLQFQDGSTVTSRDVVASLRRWMGLDIVGRTMAIDVATLQAIDDQTIGITLRRPFPVDLALANSGSGLPVIMREKEATAGPFTKDC